MSGDRLQAILNWLDSAELQHENSEGVKSFRVILPEPLLETLVSHLQRLRAMADMEGSIASKVARAGMPPEGYQGEGIEPRRLLVSGPHGKPDLPDAGQERSLRPESQMTDHDSEVPNLGGVEAAEANMEKHGATKVVSTWWSEPYVMAVLADGRTLIVNETAYEPSHTIAPGPPRKLVQEVKDGEWECRECACAGRAVPATDVAYCCGSKEWWAACAACAEDFDQGSGGCP